MDLSVIHDLFQESANFFIQYYCSFDDNSWLYFLQKNTIHVNNFLIYKLGILLLRPSFH